MTKSGTRLLRKQPLWGMAIGLLFVVDFVFYGYMPSHRRLQNLARARNQRELAATTARAQAESLPTLEQRHKETIRMVQRYEDYVPTESALGVFLGQIADIMTQYQLTDQEVKPGSETTAHELNCIPVRMNCTGTLDALFGFFCDLQNLHRLVRIEKIVLTNDNRFTGVVSMETDAVIFYRPQAASGPDDSTDKQSSKRADNEA